jgi:gliding motility-associated lipoprotein GldH
MYLNVRNRGDYSNRNIWLSVGMYSPEGRLTTDTVEFILADPSGRWKGSGIGDLFDNRILYKQDMEFPVAGEYRFMIRQAMRPVRLKGIYDVGMRLEKVMSIE